MEPTEKQKKAISFIEQHCQVNFKGSTKQDAIIFIGDYLQAANRIADKKSQYYHKLRKEDEEERRKWNLHKEAEFMRAHGKCPEWFKENNIPLYW